MTLQPTALSYFPSSFNARCPADLFFATYLGHSAAILRNPFVSNLYESSHLQIARNHNTTVSQQFPEMSSERNSNNIPALGADHNLIDQNDAGKEFG